MSRRTAKPNSLQPHNTIFLANIPFVLTEQQVLDLVEDRDKMTRYYFPKNSKNESTGTCFVSFDNKESCEKNMAKLNLYPVEGRVVECRWAKNRKAEDDPDQNVVLDITKKSTKKHRRGQDDYSDYDYDDRRQYDRRDRKDRRYRDRDRHHHHHQYEDHYYDQRQQMPPPNMPGYPPPYYPPPMPPTAPYMYPPIMDQYKMNPGLMQTLPPDVMAQQGQRPMQPQYPPPPPQQIPPPPQQMQGIPPNPYQPQVPQQVPPPQQQPVYQPIQQTFQQQLQPPPQPQQPPQNLPTNPQQPNQQPQQMTGYLLE